MVGKYLKIFHRGVGESTGLSKATTPQKILCGQYPKQVEKGKSYVSFSADQSPILMQLWCGSLTIMMTLHKQFGTAHCSHNVFNSTHPSFDVKHRKILFLNTNKNRQSTTTCSSGV